MNCICEHILEMVSETGDIHVRNHFKSKVFKRDLRINKHNPLHELDLKIKAEVLAAEEAIIKKHMDELGS